MSKQKQQPALTPISYHPRSQEHQELIEQARRLEMLSIGFMISVVTLMYLASGNSQSMKTALLEDVLSLIPPAAFLLGHRWSQKKPTPWFCFGFQRTVLIAYLTAAVALLGLGSFAVIDSAINLLTAHKPTLGSMVFQGQVVWQGWVMLVVLLYSAIPLVILGHKKSKLAKKLGDDVLMADAATNKADWMTGLAAAVGVIGLGFGIWWLDSVMALLIALDIVRDGTVYLKNAVGKLMDRAPSVVGDFDKPHPLIGKIREKILQFGKGDLCELRVRSLGRYVTGQAVVAGVSDFEEIKAMEEALHEEFPELINFVVTAC